MVTGSVALHVKRFLAELEAKLASLPERERAELAEAYRIMLRGIVTGVTTIGKHFKPSKGAGLALIWELVGALGNGPAFLDKLKKTAKATGPNVTSLVHAL